ncbi:MAG: tetratricopeptide repeat protein [Polyangiaceae bacterium]
MKTRAFAVLGALALSVLLSACSRNPIEAVNLSNEGDKARGANIDEAISKYEQAVTLDPSNHRILWKLATAYQKKEAWDKVASTLARAEKVAPTFANYYFLHGHAMVKQADAPKPTAKWDEAKDPLSQAIKLDPNIADAYFDMAEVLLHLDDEAGAMQNYTKAIEAKPDELTFYGPLAELYIANKFYDQADQVLKEGLGFKKEGDKTAYIIYSLMGRGEDGEGRLVRLRHRLREREEGMRSVQREGAADRLLQPRRRLLARQPAAQERGDSAAPGVLQDRVPRRRREALRGRVQPGERDRQAARRNVVVGLAGPSPG